MGLAPYGEPRYAERYPRPPDRSERRTAVRLDHGTLHDATGVKMTIAQVPRTVRRAATRADHPVTQREMDSAALRPEGDRGGRAAPGADLAETDLGIGTWFGRWRGAQLRRQRHACPRDKTFERDLDSSRPPATRAAPWARPCVYHQHLTVRIVEATINGMRGSYLGPEFAPNRMRAVAATWGPVSLRTSRGGVMFSLRRAELLRAGTVVGWFQGRMEFGLRALLRVRSADPGRPARSPDAAADESQDQESRDRSVRSYRRCSRRKWLGVFRERPGPTAPTCSLVADVAPGRARQHDPRGGGPVRIRQAQRVALRDPLRHARRSIRRRARPCTPRPTRATTRCCRPSSAARGARCWSTPASTCAASPSSARRRTPYRLLHGHGHGDARGRRLHPFQGRAGPGACSGLTSTSFDLD